MLFNASTRTRSRNINATTNGRDQLSLSSMDTSTRLSTPQLGHDLVISTPLPMDVISYQYPPWIQGHNYQCQNNGHDPQPVYQNREWLLSCSNLYGVYLSTSVFQAYMLQVKVNRCNYNSYVTSYTTWSRQSYVTYCSTVEIVAIEKYVIIYKAWLS